MNKIFLFLLTVLSLSSCTGMYDSIEEYWDRGEIAYIGMPDSAVVYGGKNRAKLEWIVNADPRIEKCIVYWNFRADSAEIEIDRSMIVDGRYSFMLNALEEGSYVFELVNVGSQGYPSMAYEAIGEVYGSQYESNLSAKKVLGFEWSGTALILRLGNDDSDHTIFKYTDTEGVEREFVCESGVTEAVLDDCDPNQSDIYYTTVYKPEEDALDTFPIESVYQLPRLLDTVGWTVTASSEQSGYETYKMLDNDVESCFHTSWDNPANYPHLIVVDMKEVYSLTEINVHGFNSDIKTIKAELSQDNENWELIGLFEFPQPATVWKSIKLPEPINARYIRLTGTEGYDSTRQYTAIAELQVYGTIKQ